MSRKNYMLGLAVFALLAAAAPAFAHHSFAAEFDGSKEFVVKGVLTKVLWTNPHVYFFMDVTQPAARWWSTRSRAGRHRRCTGSAWAKTTLKWATR